MTTMVSQGTLWRVRISPHVNVLDAHGVAVLRDIHELGLPQVERVASSRLFLLQGPIDEQTAEQIGTQLLSELREKEILLGSR